MTVSDALTIVYTPQIFTPFIYPDGMLDQDMACHALWFYYLNAMDTYENQIRDQIVYEGDPDPELNFMQIFSSAALIYGVEPERMLKFWGNVDAQAKKLNYPELMERYKFKSTPEIRTQ